MKKIIAVLLCAAFASLSLCSCTNADNFSGNEILSSSYTRSTNSKETNNYSDGATESPSSYNTFTSEITDFELRLFRNYSTENHNGTYAINPSSVSSQLSLLANGASDDTQREILNTISDELTLENLNICSSYFTSRLTSFNTESKDDDSEKSKGKISFQNTLFCNDNSDIKTRFLQNNADFYSDNIIRFMFSDKNSQQKINNLYKDYTSSKLSMFDKNSSIVSYSASDICDAWLEPYAKSDVTSGIFSSSNGSKSVNYLSSVDSYLSSSKAKGIVKFTRNTPLKFMAVIPNKSISVEDYISSLNYNEFSSLIESFDIKNTVNTKLPEFSADESTKDLSSYIKTCGAKELFSSSNATFSNMCSSKNIFISSINEITPKISVNAGGIGGKTTCGDSAELSKHTDTVTKPDESLNFDRPFVFFILDNESNIPIYIGAVDF